MKNRTIPFGYMMRNGEIQPKPTESKAVQNIFQAYLNGSSLLAIANWMSSQGIPYNGIDFVWNKNMIKRILENEKYLGRNGYPAIIDENMFAEQICGRKLNRLQSSRFLRSFRQSAVLHIVRNAVIGFQESAAIRTLKNGTAAIRNAHDSATELQIRC